MLENSQLSLADESPEYRAFVEKFKPKKTTDDCYTPDNVYKCVADWVAKEYGVDPARIVRPFWPGGDYERMEYPEGCVVVDNPPFSILSKIVAFYNAHGIRYFLFAPALTLLNVKGAQYVAACCKITYENGANINTSFVTNLERDSILRSAPELSAAIESAEVENCKEFKNQQPAYTYPSHVVTAALVGRLSHYGVYFHVSADECAPIRVLDSQRAAGKAIFGGGFLLSDAAAERFERADALASRIRDERAAQDSRDVKKWTLSDRELQMVEMLGAKDGA